MVPSHHICRVARSKRSNRLSTPPPLLGLKIRGIKTFLYCSIYSRQKCWPPWPLPLPRYKYIYMFSYKKHWAPSPPPHQQKSSENFLSDVNNVFTWSCRVLGVGEAGKICLKCHFLLDQLREICLIFTCCLTSPCLGAFLFHLCRVNPSLVSSLESPPPLPFKGILTKYFCLKLSVHYVIYNFHFSS